MVDIQEENRQAAIWNAQCSHKVFPATAEKRPMFKDWQRSATNDVEVIAGSWPPDAIPAIATGQSGLLVIDCDVKGGKNGVAEMQRLDASNQLGLEAYPMVQTLNGGLHIYMRQSLTDPLGSSQSKIGPGIDTKGVGGLVMAPYSIFPQGQRYTPVRGTLAEIPQINPRAHEFLKVHLTTGRARLNAIASASEKATPEMAMRALQQAVAELSKMGEGSGRNNALNDQAFHLAEFVRAGLIDRQLVEQQLRTACEYNGYLAKDGLNAVLRTIKSGLDAQAMEPFQGLHLPMRRPRFVHKEPILRSVAETASTPIYWIWPQRIALGKLALLAGHPGLGKSQLATWIAAQVTTGGQWPNGEGTSPTGTVIMLSCEDDVSDTIRPRLEAVGADITRVIMLEAVRSDGVMKAFSLTDDIPQLEAAFLEYSGVKLVIIDPITAYLGKGIDSHRTADIRAVLAPLQALAAKFGVAVLAISHLNKHGGNGVSINAITGSGAFVAASRSVLLVTKDEGQAGRRLLAEVKNNLGNAPTLAFNIQTRDFGNGIKAPFVVFAEGVVEITADEALGEALSASSGGTFGEAKQFLTEELSQGAIGARQLIAAAKNAGISERKLRRAAAELGVVKTKDGYQGVWMWSLPSKATKDGNII